MFEQTVQALGLVYTSQCFELCVLESRPNDRLTRPSNRWDSQVHLFATVPDEY